MSHARRYCRDSTRPPTSPEGAAFQPMSLFFKADRRRPIDPYIDYFGDTPPSAAAPRLEMERAG